MTLKPITGFWVALDPRPGAKGVFAPGVVYCGATDNPWRPEHYREATPEEVLIAERDDMLVVFDYGRDDKSDRWIKLSDLRKEKHP